jgi:hypothetical protein
MARPTIASTEANLMVSYAGKIAEREPGLWRLHIPSRDVEVRVRYHESGHAVMGLVVGQAPHDARVRTGPEGVWGGVHFRPAPPNGYAETWTGETDRKEQDQDLRLLWLLIGCPSIWVLRARLKQIRQATRALVRQYWSEVRTVALALLERRTLSGAEIQAILRNRVHAAAARSGDGPPAIVASPRAGGRVGLSAPDFIEAAPENFGSFPGLENGRVDLCQVFSSFRPQKALYGVNR